jgi:hypothetical protein
MRPSVIGYFTPQVSMLFGTLLKFTRRSFLSASFFGGLAGLDSAFNLKPDN